MKTFSLCGFCIREWMYRGNFEGNEISDILSKLSSYNIFNYLLPGTLFAAAGSTYTSYSLVQENLFVAGFVYYFFGLVISRVDCLIVEPILKNWRFVNFAEYGQFVTACQSDKTLAQLSEANNMYRTLTALLLFLGALAVYDASVKACPLIRDFGHHAVFAGLLILFLFSYRKQTYYISKRVTVVNGSD